MRSSRLFGIIAALVLVTGCAAGGSSGSIGWPRPNVPRPAPTPNDYTLRIETEPAGVLVRNDAQPSMFSPIWVNPPNAEFFLDRTNFNICGALDGYDEICKGVGDFPVDPVTHVRTVRLVLTKKTAPVVTAPKWREGHAAIDKLRTDIGSALDSHGDLMWMGNTAAAMEAGRFDDWAARWRAMGLTHIVIGDFRPGGYPGFPISNPDWRDPAKIRAALLRILNTPAADGLGFTPVVMFDGGSYPDSTPRWRIDNEWTLIHRAVTEGGIDLRPFIKPVFGWELRIASDFDALDISYAAKWMSAHGFQHITAHNSPTRTAQSTHCDPAVELRRDRCTPHDPNDLSKSGYETNDPWKGDEAGSFQTAGGELVETLFFQVDPPRPGDNLDCDYALDDRCWLNRFNDAVLRLGHGYHGWRKMGIDAFEAMVFWAFRGLNVQNYAPGAWSAEFARQVATAMKKVCDKPIALEDGGRQVVYPPVDCGFGNGLPLLAP